MTETIKALLVDPTKQTYKFVDVDPNDPDNMDATINLGRGVFGCTSYNGTMSLSARFKCYVESRKKLDKDTKYAMRVGRYMMQRLSIYSGQRPDGLILLCGHANGEDCSFPMDKLQNVKESLGD